MIWMYFLGFAIVSTVLLKVTNRPGDPWPGITAVGCFGVGLLWPLLLPIVMAGSLAGGLRKALRMLLSR